MQPKTRHYQLTASEFDWKISEEKTVKAWGFNRQLPGPELRAEKGDTLMIHVTNNLSQPTMVHWHGIRLPAAMDGTDEVQPLIQPGETFVYRFEVPDAGTFWYHSHHNETVQMERGLYGALIVSDRTDPLTDGERVFVLDDMKLTGQNEFKKGGPVARWMERHDGREGSTLLVNGREGSLVRMSAGQVERWRFINASSARYVRLSLDGREFPVMATDGGLLQFPRRVSEVMLTPGERVDILAGPFTEGDSFAIASLPYNRTTFVKSVRSEFARVEVGASLPSKAFIPERLRRIEPLASKEAAVNRKLRFSVGASLRHGIDFLVNGQVHAVDEPVRAGELQVWELSNTSLMDHPFHLHGFFFQVLEEDGRAPDHLSWKDTYNLKPGSKVKIAWLPDNRPGRWMYHCHILEHHAAGMMGHFEVVDGSGPAEKRSRHELHRHQH